MFECKTDGNSVKKRQKIKIKYVFGVEIFEKR